MWTSEPVLQSVCFVYFRFLLWYTWSCSEGFPHWSLKTISITNSSFIHLLLQTILRLGCKAIFFFKLSFKFWVTQTCWKCKNTVGKTDSPLKVLTITVRVWQQVSWSKPLTENKRLNLTKEQHAAWQHP